MESITLDHYLVLSALVFGVGLYLALAKRNAVGVLIGVELMFNAVNLTLIAFSRFSESATPIAGHVFVLFVITVSAAEAAVALALAVLIYRQRRSIDIDKLNLLRW